MGVAFEIAVHASLDFLRADAFQDGDSNDQAPWERWHDHPMEDRAGLQTRSFDAKLLQPTKPGFEAVEAFYRRPHLLGRGREAERSRVLDHVRRGGHDLRLCKSGRHLTVKDRLRIRSGH
jgi:hypothetical protein